jgi:formylglycine-generating enzyme required for sulfatase activity
VAQAADPTSPLSVNPTTIEATANADTYTVEVTSTAMWSSEVNGAAASWCSLSPDWFAGDRTVTVRIADNQDSQPRSALITLTSGALKKQIVVNQAAFWVSPTSIDVPIEGGAYPIAVTADAEWTAESTATWCTITPASGSGNGTATVNVAENSSWVRSTTVTFTSGTLQRQLVVNQARNTDVTYTFTANGVSFDIIPVPGGTTTLNSSSVTLTSFNIGKYEVTQGLWYAVMGYYPGTAPSSTYGGGSSYPM